MLQYVEENQVTLPIHDNLIMRKGYASYLEQAVQRALYEKFGSDIKIKQEVIMKRVPLINSDGTPRTEEVTQDYREHSQWYD